MTSTTHTSLRRGIPTSIAANGTASGVTKKPTEYLDISSSDPDSDVSGQIPPSVGDLPYLQFLTFHKLPNLVGPIQPTIAKLTKLKSLIITNTGISGPVPDFLSQLTNL
ncbi:hypothetical protein VIGAN_02277400 [Vigna angularis var. angularis]|uniref:Uncharacterized protein n=1 Tax=Vigna angularis var. angularis TaxID=157739 RepID=A0A0S3RH08_PHAAN|nr:hypothetical protein VIGAN_02277400 [Vigna angularis var. angularis]